MNQQEKCINNDHLNGLPPSKRFKFLNPQQKSNPNCLPAKKRLNTYENTSSMCLPAKKRIWAPNPLSPIKKISQINAKDVANEDEKEADVVNEDDKEFKDDDEIEDDDGVLCDVCHSTDGDPLDPIVFCDGCDLMVHASCYGNPLITSIPQDDWFCEKCKQDQTMKDGKMDSCSCCLCPAKSGALKSTTDGRWAHIVCALLVPEVFFKDPVGRDGIDCSQIPQSRWKKDCYVCKKSNIGCVIECSERKCKLGFHVCCGLDQELCFEYKENRAGTIVAGFCEVHTQLWKKQQLTGKFKIVAREEKEKI